MLDSFIHFLNHTPCAYHAIKNLSHYLMEDDFYPLSEKENWSFDHSKGFVIKDKSALCAFILPKKAPKKSIVLASHVDSPMFKLKPNIADPNQLGLELYGAPLLYTYLGIDLAISGRIFLENEKGEIEEESIYLDEYPIICPPLPIHLDREIYTKGLHLNRQQHLVPFLSVDKSTVASLIEKRFPKRKILSYDLFLSPAQKASYTGLDLSLIASHGLDNLSSAFASMQTITQQKPLEETLIAALFFDHEEVGSNTNQGAGSFFFYETLKRIALHYKLTDEEFFMLKSRSLCLSLDVVLGFQKGHEEKFDPSFSAHLGKGPAIKYHAGQKYITPPQMDAFIRQVAKQESIGLQSFCGRNDIPTGSTIGPIFSAMMNIPTLDLGIPILGMHSAREVMASSDMHALVTLLQSALQKSEHLPVDIL